MIMTNATREEWLVAAVELLRPMFDADAIGKPVPKRVQISVGWAKRPGKGIGWCYPAEAVADGAATTIFISPERESDEILILCTVLHEMVHAADNCESGHRGWFAKTVKAFGFNGKPTSSQDPGDALRAILKAHADTLGPYPHLPLELGGGADVAPKQTTRQLKAVCACGYTIRVSRKWIDQGLPTCSCGGEFEESI